MSLCPNPIARRPSLTIQLAVEAKPHPWMDCLNDSEESRLLDWINGNDELAEVVDRAVEIRDAAEAV
jgi:hypothetical protein